MKVARRGGSRQTAAAPLARGGRRAEALQGLRWTRDRNQGFWSICQPPWRERQGRRLGSCLRLGRWAASEPPFGSAVARAGSKGQDRQDRGHEDRSLYEGCRPGDWNGPRAAGEDTVRRQHGGFGERPKRIRKAARRNGRDRIHK